MPKCHIGYIGYCFVSSELFKIIAKMTATTSAANINPAKAMSFVNPLLLMENTIAVAPAAVKNERMSKKY